MYFSFHLSIRFRQSSIDTVPFQQSRVWVKVVKTKVGSNFRMQSVKCSPLRLLCDVRWRFVRKWAKTHKQVADSGQDRRKKERKKEKKKKKSALSQNRYVFHYSFQNIIGPLSVMLPGAMQDVDNSL